MGRTAFVSHSDCSLHDTGWNHPEHQGRLPALARAVYRDMLTLFDHLLEVEAVPAAEQDLRLVHTAEHLDTIRAAVAEAGRRGQPVRLEADTVVSAASWDAARAAVGTALTGVNVVVAGEARNAFCAARPPGRNARAGHAAGFSLFNNVAVAARHLQQRHGVERMLVVDWGGAGRSGTAEILGGDPGIRVAAVRCTAPTATARARGTSDSADAALPAGASSADFALALELVLDAATRGFVPEFVLLGAGFDVLAGDPLGDLALLPVDFHALTRQVRERADALCGGRLVSVLEGGYEPRATGLAVVQHLRALADLAPA